MRPKSGSALSLVVLLTLVFAGCTGSGSDDEDSLPVTWHLACTDPCGTAIDAGRRWEPSVAVDPDDGDHIVASSQDLSRRVGLTSVHWALAHVSFDGGETWETQPIPGGSKETPDHPLYRYDAMDDSVVKILPDGTVLWTVLAWTRAPPDSMPGRAPPALVVLRSEDGGRTFPEVVTVQEGSGWQHDDAKIEVDYQDKPWLTIGPDGDVLLVWARNHRGSTVCGDLPGSNNECVHIVFSRSTDSGRTWTEPAIITDQSIHSGPYPVIRSDGGWVVSYHETHTSKVWVAISDDQGQTWTHHEIDHATKFPVLVQRKHADGERIYMAYPGSKDDRDDLQNISLRWSDDGGHTWNGPLLVDRPEHAGRTTPAIAPVGDDAIAILYWYPLEQGAELRIALVRDDTVVSRTTLATIDGDVRETGDYMGLDATPDGQLYAVWNAHDGETGTITGAHLRLVSEP